MASYRQLYYHIVFGTKFRSRSIPDANCEELYKYIWGFVKNKKSVLYRINGSTDHLHLLVDIHPTIALSTFVKELNVSTSIWLKQQKGFEHFVSWAEGFAAFTISHNDRDRVIEYIKTQKEHHKKINYTDEYKSLLDEFGIQFNEDDFD